MVASARHAVALDEMRRSFEPTCWENIDELNRAAAATGDSAPYQEKYFAGDHGSVGGGGEIESLSSIALCWIAEGAMNQGLNINSERLKEAKSRQDPFGPLRNTMKPPRGFANYIMRRSSRSRSGPAKVDQLHSSVLVRWKADGSKLSEPYRPGSLTSLHAELEAFENPSKPSDGALRIS